MERSSSVLIEVVGFLEERFPAMAPISAKTHISRDLGLDSLAAMDLLMSLEDRFDVSIPLNALPEIEAVGDLATLIDGTRSGATR
jgi:acyl carrier protein